MNQRLGAFAIAIACVACGRDVRLGSLAADAASDVAIDTSSSANPFTAGSYTAQFLDPVDIMCAGALSGNEPSFQGLTRAALHLIDGTVTLATPTATDLTIAGSPVMNALGQPSVDLLVPSDPSAPPIWTGVVTGDLSAGPVSTTQSEAGFAANSSTANVPTGIEGFVSFLYANSGNTGTCSVTYGVLLTHV